MNAYEHWEATKEPLRRALNENASLADVVRSVRHALLQTEQNTLAEEQDDVLRQQLGVLFGCVKNTVGLLEANITTQVWVPQKRQKAQKGGKITLWTIAIILQACCALYAYSEGLWLLLALLVAAPCVCAAALLIGRKKTADVADEVHVTLRPDVERLFAILDGQMRAIDRYRNDFDYLNGQLRGGGDSADNATVAGVATLLEALYDVEDEAQRAPAEQAARRVLESMGLRAMDYAEEHRGWFNALPSKTETRTLCPAILSSKDERLLRRGVATVKMDAA